MGKYYSSIYAYRSNLENMFDSIDGFNSSIQVDPFISHLNNSSILFYSPPCIMHFIL